MLLVNKVCLCFFLLVWTWTTSNSLVLSFVSLLLSLYEWWNLSDHILVVSSRWYEAWYSWLTLSTSLCNESSTSSIWCIHYRHTSMFTHRWLLTHLKFACQWYTRWSTLTNAAKVWSYSFISCQILMWNVTELSLMLCIRETVIVKFIL